MSDSRPTAAERRKRRAEFSRVTAFLDKRGYHLGHGYGSDEDVAYHGGHRQRRLAEIYEDPQAWQERLNGSTR